MIKIGLQANYWNGTGAEKDIFQALKLTAEAGAEVFEYGTSVVMALSALERGRLRDTVKDYGMEIILNGGVSNLSAADPIERIKAIEISKSAISTAQEVGAKIWSGIIYGNWLDTPSKSLTCKDRAVVWERAVASVREIADFAAQCGVTICFEIVNRFEQYLVTTAAEGVRFTEEINSPAAKLLLDTFHMNIEEDSTPDAIRMTAAHGKLGHIHMSESNRRLPGLMKTDMDWDSILGAMVNSGYSGTITLEPMVMMEAPLAYKYRTWRDMTLSAPTIESMSNELKKSISFVRNKITMKR